MSEASEYPTRNLRRMVADPVETITFEATAKSTKKRIMLVVPGRLFRNGIESVLRGSDRVIIGDCETLDQVEAALGALPAPDQVPDLFVIGIAGSSSAADEFARIRALRAKMPASRWIVLSRSAGIEFLHEAIETGIEGMLLEDSPGEALQLVAELVLLGHSFVPVDLARVLADASRAAAPAARAVTSDVFVTPRRGNAIAVAETSVVSTGGNPGGDPARRWQVSLSDRENEILHCLVAGHPNKLIARELRIAEATVKVHVKALLRKMQVTNRTQAAISALQFLRTPEGSARAAHAHDVETAREADRHGMVNGAGAAILRLPERISFRHPAAE